MKKHIIYWASMSVMIILIGVGLLVRYTIHADTVTKPSADLVLVQGTITSGITHQPIPDIVIVMNGTGVHTNAQGQYQLLLSKTNRIVPVQFYRDTTQEEYQIANTSEQAITLPPKQSSLSQDFIVTPVPQN